MRPFVIAISPWFHSMNWSLRSEDPVLGKQGPMAAGIRFYDKPPLVLPGIIRERVAEPHFSGRIIDLDLFSRKWPKPTTRAPAPLNDRG
jgi:hypothetical protein